MIYGKDKDMNLKFEKEGKGYSENILQKFYESTETKVILSYPSSLQKQKQKLAQKL